MLGRIGTVRVARDALGGRCLLSRCTLDTGLREVTKLKETRKLILVLLLLTLILPCGFIQAAPGPIKELMVVNEMLTIPRDEMGKYGEVLTAEIGQTLGALNGRPELWRVDETSSTLIIDVTRLRAALRDDADLILSNTSAVFVWASRWNGIQVTVVKSRAKSSGDFSALTLTPYYDHNLLDTWDGSDQTNTPVTDWLRGPGEVGRYWEWTYNWTWTDGGGNASSGLVLGWLACNPSWGYSEGGTYTFPVPAGQEGRVVKEDNFYYTYAEYDEWYYYENPDIPDQWLCTYTGRYTARSKKFWERVYWCEYRPAT